MPSISDPAKDIAELCQYLSEDVNNTGYSYLSKKFDLAPWSPEFYQILFCIIERIDSLSEIIKDLEIDDDQKEQAQSDLLQIRGAFHIQQLSVAWNNHQNGGFNNLLPEYTKPIKALSPVVRKKISYPKLSQEEKEDLLADVDQLSEWLFNHQIKQQDFIRQAILDGLDVFRFRLTVLDWVGWGYVLESLKEVIGAYMALERGFSSETDNPDSAAVLRKVSAAIKNFYDKTQLAREFSETGDFVLKTYGAVSMIADSSGIGGILTGPN